MSSTSQAAAGSPNRAIQLRHRELGLSPSLLSKPRGHFSCEPPPKPCTSSSAGRNHSSHALHAPSSRSRSPDTAAWPVPRRLGASAPVAQGKQTAFPPGLLPLATAAALGWPGCAGRTAGRFSEVQPCGRCGLSCRRCLPPWLAESRAETTNKQETCTAWLGLHIGNRDKLLQKADPREAAERGGEGSWGAGGPGRRQLPPLGAGEGKHPKVRAGAPSHAAAASSAVQRPAPATRWGTVRLGWRARSHPLTLQPALPGATWPSPGGDGGQTKGSKSLSCCG